MEIESRNIGIILGAGVGRRFGGAIPKQFLKVAGKTVFEHSVDAFSLSDVIDEIALVVGAEYVNFAHEITVRNNWRKVAKVLTGGKERHNSVLTAIHAYKEVVAGAEKHIRVNMFFHDAARPLVDQRILSDVAGALLSSDAVGVAIPATDTVFVANASDPGFYAGMPDRRYVYQCQTPQAFNLETISSAYEIAVKDPDFAATDDCGVILRYLPETKIRIVIGSRDNIKLTHDEDLFIIERLLTARGI